MWKMNTRGFLFISKKNNPCEGHGLFIYWNYFSNYCLQPPEGVNF